MSTAQDRQRLREVAQAATPGSWCWAGNIDSGEPYLVSRGPGMAASVLAIGTEDRSTTGRRADEVRSYAEECGAEDPDEWVTQWATDNYGEPIKEPRLWFYRDHLAVEARDHVRFEVAPQATSREDPKVYRADITDVLLPDAQHIATFDPSTVLALLDELEAVERERDEARLELSDADIELQETDAQLTRLWELHEEYISENVDQRQEINRLRDRAEAAEGKLAKVREVVERARDRESEMAEGVATVSWEYLLDVLGGGEGA